MMDSLQTSGKRKFSSFQQAMNGPTPSFMNSRDVTPLLPLNTNTWSSSHLSTENPQPSLTTTTGTFNSLSVTSSTSKTMPKSTPRSMQTTGKSTNTWNSSSKQTPITEDGTRSTYFKRSSSKGAFSNETPYFSNTDSTPLILATARQSGSTIMTSCNRDSIRYLQNPYSDGPVVGVGISSESITFNKKSRTKSKSRSATSSATRDDSDGPSTSMTEADTHTLRNISRDETSLSTDTQIYMGVLWHMGKLGVAYYDLDTTIVYVMLDTQETDDFKFLIKVIQEIKPVQIIVSSKQDERMLKVLRNHVSESHDGDESDRGGATSMLQFLPSIDFSAEICKRRVLSLQLPSLKDHFTEMERAMYITSLIPFENVAMIRAMGGLLKYLEKMRIGIELEEASVRLPVLDVKIVAIESQMILDETAYCALQIFQKEAHPSVYKTGTNNGGKEGLSLFGIMNRTKSQIGSRMLRKWFQRPLMDKVAIEHRHAAIGFFNNPRNVELINSFEDAVKNVKNISTILKRMLTSQATVGGWQALYKTFYNATAIRELCGGLPQSINIFRQITETFPDDLHRITSLINKIIDFPECVAQSRFVVKPHVDENLDKKKRIFSGLPEYLTEVAYGELNKLGDQVTECSILYIPQIGYLLAVPETNIVAQSNENYPLELEGLDFVFRANNVMHYRSTRTRELDSLLGDTRCDITDMETAIMHKLQNNILEHSSTLLNVLELTAELDCLLSLAACAREYNYVRPTLTDDNVIEIEAGRHPIQEMCCHMFVPNDVQSNEDYGKIKILTGPNACGKSVYLKQIPLIVYLAQIGSFVPAEFARLGLVDRIFTRIRSIDSVSVGLSTFMIDINQMSEALRNAGKRSLCIVDEFGKGTDMIDGMALLCSCLKYWLNQGDECPHVFVSTHFHGIIHHSIIPRSPMIKYLTLETLHNGEELVFLYQLVEGHTSSSYACHVASQAGLPDDIVRRGSEVSELINQGKPPQRRDEVSYDAQLKRCQSVVNKFLELNLEEADVRSFLKEFVLPTMDGKLLTTS